MKCPHCGYEITERPITYTLRDVAKLMGVSYTSAIDMAKRGEIELLPTAGRSLIVPARWVDKFRPNTDTAA